MEQNIVIGLDEITKRVDDLLEAARVEISAASTMESLDKLKIKFLGRQGEITTLVRSVGQVEQEQRRAVGQAVNQAKKQVEDLIEARRAALQVSQASRETVESSIDVTLPGMRALPGHIHPLT